MIDADRIKLLEETVRLQNRMIDDLVEAERHWRDKAMKMMDRVMREKMGIDGDG